MKLKIIEIAGHRNGVAGAHFCVVLFKERGADPKVAIVFDEWSCFAVLDVAKLAKGDIAFGSNSWRADDYEPYLRDAIDLLYGKEPPEAPSNESRAQQFHTALSRYGSILSPMESVTDMLADARHWCDRQGLSFCELDQEAFWHYREELNEAKRSPL